jgi:hypothetical protein
MGTLLKAVYACFMLLLAFTNVQGQVRTINGYLRDSITHYPISGGTITNATSGKRIQSDERGFFRLEAKANDPLYAVAPAYRFDTLIYSPLFADTITIYLSPTGAVLPTVTVTAQYTKYQLDSIQRREAFEENKGTVMRRVAPTPSTSFGLTINLDRFFKKKYQRQKQQERTFRKTEEALYVHYRFSPQLVSYYTGLKGEQLRAFMLRYTPSYNWLRQHPSNEAVMYYLNEKIKEFRASQRHTPFR